MKSLDEIAQEIEWAVKMVLEENGIATARPSVSIFDTPCDRFEDSEIVTDASRTYYRKMSGYGPGDPNVSFYSPDLPRPTVFPAEEQEQLRDLGYAPATEDDMPF